jgi:hypothetical protein
MERRLGPGNHAGRVTLIESVLDEELRCGTNHFSEEL